MFPSKRRKTYRQYLTPGADYVVPKSTERYREGRGETHAGANVRIRPTATAPKEASRNNDDYSIKSCEADESFCLGNLGSKEIPAAAIEEGTNSDNMNEGLSEEESLSTRNVGSAELIASPIEEDSTSSDGSCEEESVPTRNEELRSSIEEHSRKDIFSDQSGEELLPEDESRDSSEESTSGEEGQIDCNVNVEDREETDQNAFGRCDFLFEDHGAGSLEPAADREAMVEDDEWAGVIEDGGSDCRSKRGGIAYADKYNLHEVIGAVTVTKSKFEVLLMIFHLVLRHGMTGPLVEDLLAFVNVICGQEILPTSKYLFNKIFKPSLFIKFHYYCEQCSRYLGERQNFREPTTLCPNCNTSCNVKNVNGTNLFVTLPLKNQLEETLQKPSIKIMSNRGESGTNICDFRDGSLFKKMFESGEFSYDDVISITFNTDGAAVFKSKHYSLWPVWIMIDNIDPSQRFLGENLILCGFWCGKHSPDFSFYLIPFVQELQELAKPGGGITLRNNNGENKIVKVVAPKACLDSVAKPKLQKIRQFNGKFGCGYCLHPGTIVGGLKTVKYPVRAEGNYPKRTAEGMRTDMFTAHSLHLAGKLRKSAKTKDHVNGLLGISPLLALPAFNIVDGFLIDYMHAILLGVTCKLLDLWEEKKEDCIIEGMSLAMVDVRVTRLKPPSDVQEPPRPLSKRSDFKAKEYRTVLLFYILTCFRGILKRPYYENVQMLVKGIFILLSERITQENLHEATCLLENFVKTYNKLYGDENMVYNVHLCTHLVDNVEAWGPLWASSAFGFESGNGDLVDLNEGTTGVASQICLKYCMVRNTRHYIELNKVSPEVLDFCADVIALKEAKKSEKFSANVRSLTNEIVRLTDDEERRVLREAGLEPMKELLTFNRVIKDKIMYYCSAYTKPKVFNDTCVRLVDGSYGVVKKIFKVSSDSEELSIFINIIRVAAVEHPAPHLKICSKDLYQPLEMRKMSDVKTKCLLLIVDDWTYVCDFPNMLEKH